MLTNELLYRIKKSLKLSLGDMMRIYHLSEYDMNEEHLEHLLKKQQNDEFELCTYEELGIFLDGLITYKRGESTNKKKTNEIVVLSNNLVLKKLRIALELKEPEIEIIFGLSGVELSKQNLSSLFRKDGHKNYKACSDELLLAFIDGLSEFYFVGELVD